MSMHIQTDQKFNYRLNEMIHLQPQDPLAAAIASKNKGNKYFRGGRYELAIKCYTDAIETCPKAKESDLSTFYQNRAAAYEQLVSTMTIFVYYMTQIYTY